MSELRTRMIRDMALRGFSPSTHEAYIGRVVQLARDSKRSPDRLTNEEVQAYLAHLIQDRKLSWSTCSQAAHAFRFLSHVTLGYSKTDFHVPAPRQPQRLPEILSREEVWRLLDACPHTCTVSCSRPPTPRACGSARWWPSRSRTAMPTA